MKTNYILAYYVFWWGNDKVGLALGTGSLYNHSGDPNMEFYRVKNHVVFKALRPIRVGEELTISYTHDRSDPQFLSPDRARFARTGSTKENK